MAKYRRLFTVNDPYDIRGHQGVGGMIDFYEEPCSDGALLVRWQADTQREWKRALCAIKHLLPSTDRQWKASTKQWLIMPSAIERYEELKELLNSDDGTEILGELDRMIETEALLSAAKRALRWRGNAGRQKRIVFALRAALGMIDAPVGYSLTHGLFGAFDSEAGIWMYEDGSYSQYSPADLDRESIRGAYQRLALIQRQFAKTLERLDSEITIVSERALFRLEMLEKYDYQCYVCDRRPDDLRLLHMHRIIPGGEYTESNVVILCVSCHRRLEGKGWDDIRKAREEYHVD